ncbi:MAG TPA: carboxypeptidase-like regulatory domain-containing protein, partial [Myxococcaceae bacterium]|nr:carboxypeptidase-like regulatory domain-containing protein [Myxococcaceae bacterium]
MTIGSATTEEPVKATTDADGNFMFKGVPAGSTVLVTISKPGFATLRASATVPVQAGNIPLNNGNASIGVAALTELNGTVKFTLVTPSGRPAAGAVAYLEASPAGTLSSSGASISNVSSVVVSGQADPQGVVTFTGVPAPSELARIAGNNGTYELWVDPVDLNGDGILEAGGKSVSFKAQDLMQYGTSQLVALPQAQNTSSSGSFANLKASNVDSLLNAGYKDPLRNMLRSGESLFVAFAHPVQAGSLLATVTDEFGLEGFSLTATPNSTGDLYTLSMPPQLVIKEGQEYNVLLRAVSAYDGSNFYRKGYFVSGDSRSPKSTALPGFVSVAFKDGSAASAVNQVLDNGECVIVTFNQLVVQPEGGGAALAPVFVNAELNNANNHGEFGAATGFPLRPAAPPANVAGCFSEDTYYPIDTSSFQYTPRYYFTFTSSASVAGGPTATVPVGTKVRLGFGHHQSKTSSAPYETAWGVPLTTDLEVDLTKL